MSRIHSCLMGRTSRLLIFTLILLFGSQSAWAGSAPEPSPFSNPLAVVMLTLMVLLLIIIAVLANLLIGTADWKRPKKKKDATVLPFLILIGAIFISPAVFAQDPGAEASSEKVAEIGGVAASTFYVMASVIFLELFIILALLINVRFLVKLEKEKTAELSVVTKPPKVKVINWWNRVNKFKPVEQEADIDLGHDYDGIRELDNKLPPWWLYGFYASILFGVIYMWRYHVSETAPLSEQEYTLSVQSAELEIQEYLKKKGESVTENTVTYLTDPADLKAGEAIYQNSCIACHKAKGAGDVGPNLADDYWIHGGDIKSIFKTIKYGVDGKGMAAWQSIYSPKEIAQISSYVKSLKGGNPENPKAPQGEFFNEENSAPANQDSIIKAQTDKTAGL